MSECAPPFNRRINSDQNPHPSPIQILEKALDTTARSLNMSVQVTDYLLKRGFNHTEEVFRQESKHLGADGKPLRQLVNSGPMKYKTAFNLLKTWVDNNLDIYKV